MNESDTERRSQRSVEIVAAARMELLERGLDGFVMRRVAERVGMALGNLQYYYRSRDDLLEAIVRAELASDVQATPAAELDGRAALERAIEQLISRWAKRNDSVYLAVSSLAPHNQRFDDLWVEIYAGFYSHLATLIADADPSVSYPVALERALLVTSILDGSSLQVTDAVRGVSQSQFERSASRLAKSVALGSFEYDA